MSRFICGGCPSWALDENGPGGVYGPEAHPLTFWEETHEWQPLVVGAQDAGVSKFHEADHRHKWVFSQETFWSEFGGDYCLVWCEVCDQGPISTDHDEFPLDIAQAIAEVHGGARPIDQAEALFIEATIAVQDGKTPR